MVHKTLQTVDARGVTWRPAVADAEFDRAREQWRLYAELEPEAPRPSRWQFQIHDHDGRPVGKPSVITCLSPEVAFTLFQGLVDANAEAVATGRRRVVMLPAPEAGDKPTPAEPFPLPPIYGPGAPRRAAVNA